MKHIDVQELSVPRKIATPSARTRCGLEVWRDEAVTLTSAKYAPPSDGVCPECKAAVVEAALKKPRVGMEQQITIDNMVAESFK